MPFEIQNQHNGTTPSTFTQKNDNVCPKVRLEYTAAPHSNFHNEKNTWTLNWREGFVGAKFTNPSKFEFTITDH